MRPRYSPSAHKKMSFPVTLEAFTEYQESELGRKAEDFEKEFFSAIVEMANEAFRFAAVGDLDAAADILAAVDKVAADQPTDEAGKHLSALCRGWIVLGCRKGLELRAKAGLLPT